MTIGEKQTLLTASLVLLLQYMQARGYEPRLKYVRRDTGGHPNSLHKLSLAADIDLFKDGKYLTNTEDHALFGDFWESLGPLHSWGGHFDDGNHYSIIHEGMK